MAQALDLAVLVSGASAVEELARIEASGIMLLHKWLPPARLRSMLAHLLRGDDAHLAQSMRKRA